MKLKYLARHIDERHVKKDTQLLSVSKIKGVVPRSEISDNEGRAEDISHYKTCLPGDLVINRMAAYQGALGIANQFGAISPDYMVLRFNKSIDPRYVGYLFKSAHMANEMSSRVKGIGSIESGSVRTPRLSWSDLGEVKVNLPSVLEQKAIADFLDRELADIDELIAKQENLIELVNERLRVFLLSFFDNDPAGNRDATGESNEWYRGVPTGWAVKRVSEVSNLLNGFPFDSESFSANEQGMPLVRIRDLIAHEFETFVPSATVPKSALVRDGDLLIGMDGDFNVKLWDRGEAALNQRVCLLRCNKPFVTKFLSLALPFALKRINELTYATTVKHLSSRQVSKIRIPIPPENELSAVYQRMQREADLAQALTKQSQDLITLSKERRSTIISAAVTGKMDIRGNN